MAPVSKITPLEGVGQALGAHVGQVVTYRGSPDGCLIYTVFTKKCQKWTKKGAPPVFNRKIECTTYGVDLLPLLVHRMGSKIDFWAYTRV